MTARMERAFLSLPLPSLRPDHWTSDAACAKPDYDPRWWDGQEQGEDEWDRAFRQDRAIAICKTECPVRQLCWESRVQGDQGVRGGKVIGERASRAKHLPKPPSDVGRPRGEIVHGTERGAKAHLRRGERPCGACREAAARAWRERSRKRREKKAS